MYLGEILSKYYRTGKALGLGGANWRWSVPEPDERSGAGVREWANLSEA